MLKKTIDTYDVEVLMNKFISIFEKHNITDITIQYNALNEHGIYDNIQEKIDITNLRKNVIYLFNNDKEVYSFYIKTALVIIEFIEAQCTIYYNTSLSSDMTFLNEDLS